MTDYLHFDGAIGSANAPDIADYDFATDVDLTLQLWVAVPDLTPATRATLIGHNNGTYTVGWSLYLETTGSMIYRYHDGTNNAVNFGVPADLVAGVRHHIAVTHDFGADEVKLFIDGVQQGATQTPGTTTGFTASATALRVGSDGDGTTRAVGDYYAAIVSTGVGTIVAGVDIGTVAAGATPIYDADFTNLTVVDLAAASFTEDSSNAATVTLTGDAWTLARIYTTHDILRETEALYMAGDGNKFHSPKWADRSGNNHHARNGSTDGADANDALGKANDGDQYVAFPGTADNYLSSPSTPALDITGDIEMTVRIRAVDYSPSATQSLMGKHSGGAANGGYALTLFIGSGFPTFRTSNGTVALNVSATASLNLVVTDGDLVWLRMTADVDDGASDATVTFYWSTDDTNDPDAVSWTQLGAVVKPGQVIVIAVSATNAAVGSSSGGSSNFDGDIYRGRIQDGIGGGVVFDAVLEDAAQPYATFTERSVNAATVTINRSTTGRVATIIDQDQWLLATDDYHEIPDAPGLNFAADESFTVMAVFRTDTIAVSSDLLVSKKADIGNAAGYALIRSIATIKGQVGDGTINRGNDAGVTETQTLYSGAFVRNVTDDDIQAFNNAVPDTPTTDDTTTTLANAFPLRFGALSDTASNFVDGQIMAVAIWRRALTDAEILDAHQLLTGRALVKDNYLFVLGGSGSPASTPDSAALDITGDIWLAARVALVDWNPSGGRTLVGKWVESGNNRSYRVEVRPTGGLLRFSWSDDGTSGTGNPVSTVAPTVVDGDTLWVAGTLDVSTGDVKFYTGGSDLVPIWVQLGTTIAGAGATSIHSAGAVVEVGSFNGGASGRIQGNVYNAQIEDGYDVGVGSLVFDADFTNLTAADLEAGNFLEDANNAVVTLNGDTWAYTRPYPHDDLLATAELLLMAHDENKFHSAKWADRSRRNHHAQNGSAAGADANDALGKRHDGDQYVFLPGTTGNWMSLPDIAAYDLTTQDFDLRVRLAATDWTPAGNKRIVAKFETSPTNGYKLNLTSGGDLEYITDNAGTFEILTSSVPVPFTDGDVGWIRVALVGTTLTFYTSTDTTDDPDDVVWTQLGVTRTTTQDPATGDNDFYIGRAGSGDTNQWAGAIYRVWFDIGGTVELDVVLEDATQPYATFTERSSNAATVTINRSSTGLRSTVIDRDQWLYTTDDRHEVADHPALNFGATDSFTVMVACRVEDRTPATTGMLVNKRASGAAGWQLLNHTSTPFRFLIGDGTVAPFDDSPNPSDRTLHTAVGVRNVTDDDIEAFRDGVGSGTATTDSTTTTLANSQAVGIGARLGGTPDEFLEGQIMAAALWRRALTDAEVLEAHALLIRQVQYLRPDSDVTVGGWTPTPATPTTLFDKLDEVLPADADFITEA